MSERIENRNSKARKSFRFSDKALRFFNFYKSVDRKQIQNLITTYCIFGDSVET